MTHLFSVLLYVSIFEDTALMCLMCWSAGDVVVAGGEDRPVCLMSPLSEDRLAAALPRQVGRMFIFCSFSVSPE